MTFKKWPDGSGLSDRLSSPSAGLDCGPDHAKPLFIKQEILTLPSLYILQCLLYVKKNINQFQSFENIHPYSTRHKANLVPIQHRVNAARNGNNYYGILFYNKLPVPIRELPYPAYKIYIEEHLKAKAYYNICEFLTDKDAS
uniref:Uncharacterized protein n=1 Tax=Cacopsylla melanoneura TaxID=428564 RepID=A0A8D8SVD6_9HEMI